MASIIQIDDKWRATVRAKRGGLLILNRTKSFSTKKDAEQWARKLETAIDDKGAEVVAGQIKTHSVTVADLIHNYLLDFDKLPRQFGATKRNALEILAGSAIGAVPVQKLTSMDVLKFARDRHEVHKAGPATLYQYVTYLRVVLNIAKPAWHIDISGAAVDEAIPVLKMAGLSGQGMQRDRRLKPGEYRKLLTRFHKIDQRPRAQIRMADVFRFAIASAFRMGEILKIRWEDVDFAKRTVIIRDRKDPKNKIGNNQVVPLIGRAWRIALAQPGRTGCIFPFKEFSIKAAWARSCDAVGIEDLHFHDLRHEGTSRLFERGFQIQEVAIVTGHKSWDMLRRYTQIKPESLHRD